MGHRVSEKADIHAGGDKNRIEEQNGRKVEHRFENGRVPEEFQIHN